MKLNYSHLSSGYIGEILPNATLNSKYYGLFFKKIFISSNSRNSIISFPQRVPRAGFYTELLSLESKPFNLKFHKIVDSLTIEYISAQTNLDSFQCANNARNFINLGNALMRYGQFDVLIDNFPSKYSGPYELEIKLLRENSIIENELSNDKPIKIDNLFTLSNRFIIHNNTTIREKISLLNSIIVNFYRYQKRSHMKRDVLKCAHLLSDFLGLLEDKSFMNQLYSSIAYRGLAMVKDFGIKHQISFLEKSESIARNLKYSDEFEQIVASENLYTCLLSMSKWRQINNDFISAVKYLQEMVALDPYDSTGYSELGFLFVTMNNIESAQFNFEKAVELGPPGTSMNLYYYAKCLEKRGYKKEAIKCLYKSAELDEQAISPWLDLLEYYSITSANSDTTIKIASHIYFTPILREQLEQNEIKYIQNILN